MTRWNVPKMYRLLIGDVSYLSKVPEHARRNRRPTFIQISHCYCHLLKWEELTSMKVRNTDVDSGISCIFIYKPLHIFQCLSHHQLQVNSQLDCEEVPVTGWIVVDLWIDKHTACARSCKYSQQTGATFNKPSRVRQASYIADMPSKGVLLITVHNVRTLYWWAKDCSPFRTSCLVKWWEKGVQWCTKSATRAVKL
jgi:hypothetical protein